MFNIEGGCYAKCIGLCKVGLGGLAPGLLLAQSRVGLWHSGAAIPPNSRQADMPPRCPATPLLLPPQDREPGIHKAIRFGAVLENVVFDEVRCVCACVMRCSGGRVHREGGCATPCAGASPCLPAACVRQLPPAPAPGPSLHPSPTALHTCLQDTRAVDFDSAAITENTRVAYPIEYMGERGCLCQHTVPGVRRMQLG